MTTIQAGSIKAFQHGVEGQVILPGSPGYDGARTVWNAMIDRRPAMIVRCTSVLDVHRAVNFARDHGLRLAVRGGGHNIAGHAMVDDGIVVDLSPMRSALVDVRSRRVIIEAGATLAHLDAATQVHGLATPLGINSSTGVAGLTLGGGFGWLSRTYGMTVDNLESVDVVTAAGKAVRANEREHPDLFWALRGGGGNFGVVTSFEFRLHPVGPELLSGLIVYSASEARSVLERYREFAREAPDELSAWAVMRAAPPLPFLPLSVHGQPVIVIAFLYAGDPVKGQGLIQPLLELGTRVGVHFGVQPYVAWQQAFDPLLAPGARNYWKSHNLSSLQDGLLDIIADQVRQLPTPDCEIFLAALGGAASRPVPASMAYANRDAQFVLNVHARWKDPADDQGCIAWARALHDVTAPFANGGVYVNFLTAEESGRVPAAYGLNYARLAEIKRRYDPENLFRTNQNIGPA